MRTGNLYAVGHAALVITACCGGRALLPDQPLRKTLPPPMVREFSFAPLESPLTPQQAVACAARSGTASHWWVVHGHGGKGAPRAPPPGCSLKRQRAGDAAFRSYVRVSDAHGYTASAERAEPAGGALAAEQNAAPSNDSFRCPRWVALSASAELTEQQQHPLAPWQAPNTSPPIDGSRDDGAEPASGRAAMDARGGSRHGAHGGRSSSGSLPSWGSLANGLGPQGLSSSPPDRPALPLSHALVMHFRSGDVFPPIDLIERGVRNPYIAMYAQPPLAYYLAAWRHSRLPYAIAISQDAKHPVVRALQMLESTMLAGRLRVLTGRDFDDDLALLLCAPHIALSASTLSAFFASQPRRTVYSYAFNGSDTGVAPCPPRRTAPSDVGAWYVWHGSRSRYRWAATSAQRLALAFGEEPRLDGFEQLPRIDDAPEAELYDEFACFGDPQRRRRR